jgi:serine/threonine-protein kinase
MGDRKRTKLGFGDVRHRAPPNELVGQTVLERYHVEAELGSGAMGVVYRGRHVRTGRSVAIKVMHDHLIHERTLVERFRREAQIAGRLRHANVVSVIDVGELADQRQVMVMELAAGESLGALMEQGPLPRARMLRLIAQLLQGLDHAHTVGLVHRDLKPENVIVEAGDVARIVDFGIAVLQEAESLGDERLTASGMIVGTPLYMAPEQAKGELVDHRADLYSLGVILYELLAEAPPFDGTAMEVAVKKIERDLPAIEGVDRLLDAFMRKLAARARDARFATARDALAVLELIERDPLAAGTALGVVDVDRALATIRLP